MRYRRLDENGDYVFGHGISDFCLDSDAVLQAAKTKLLLLRGEWWENLFEGTEVFEKILGASVDDRTKDQIDILIKDRILDVEGVLSIKNFDSKINKNARTYFSNIIIETIYGDIEKQVTIGG